MRKTARRKNLIKIAAVALAALALPASTSFDRSPAPTLEHRDFALTSEVLPHEKTAAETKDDAPPERQTAAVEPEKEVVPEELPGGRRIHLDPSIANEPDRPRVIDSYKRQHLPETHYDLVKGLHGSLQKLSHLNEVTHISGVNYYAEDGSGREPANVVFDRTHQRYGAWSGEIFVLLKNERSAADIERLFPVDRVSVAGRRAIFKARSDFDLATDYPALVRYAGDETSVRLDLKFDRLSP